MRPTKIFALHSITAYDFGWMTRHACGLLLVIGCATPMTAMRDDNRRLNQTVSELRVDRRAQDRKVRDLQHQVDQLRAMQIPSMVEGSMPTLPTEVVTPPAADPSPEAPRLVAIADDGTEIFYEGDAAAGRAATFDDEPDPAPRRAPRAAAPQMFGGPAVAERLEVTRRIPPLARSARTPSRGADAPTERSDDASRDYRAAVDLVKASQHTDAIAALRAFLLNHPRHDYADNAQYWLGEAFYAQKDYPRALAEFRNVIETYPRGNKVPDALLKVGFCYGAMVQPDKAKAVLEQVVRLYPKSEPAALAARRLETP